MSYWLFLVDSLACDSLLCLACRTWSCYKGRCSDVGGCRRACGPCSRLARAGQPPREDRDAGRGLRRARSRAAPVAPAPVRATALPPRLLRDRRSRATIQTSSPRFPLPSYSELIILLRFQRISFTTKTSI